MVRQATERTGVFFSQDRHRHATARAGIPSRHGAAVSLLTCLPIARGKKAQRAICIKAIEA